MAKQFPDCTEIEFTVSQPAFEELLKNFETKVDDGIKTDATEKRRRDATSHNVGYHTDIRRIQEGES